MNFEKEITVSINVSKEDLLTYFNANGYKKIDNYIMEDIYYVMSDVDFNLKTLEILKKSILLRSVGDEKHYLVYKYKEFDENENIVKQGKSKVQVNNKDDATSFLQTIGYKEIIRIVDRIEVYEKDGLQLCVQEVNDKYLFIEIEESDKFNTIEKMIEAIENTNIDYDKGDYFVKKAKIVFEEKYRSN